MHLMKVNKICNSDQLLIRFERRIFDFRSLFCKQHPCHEKGSEQDFSGSGYICMATREHFRERARERGRAHPPLLASGH